MPTYLDEDGNETQVYLTDEEISGPAADSTDTFGYRRTGTALAKGLGEAAANLGRLTQRGMATAGIRTGDPIPERLEALEVEPGFEVAKGLGKLAPSLAAGAVSGGLGATTGAGAIGGAMQTGDEQGAALGAAGGAAFQGAGALVGKVRQLVAALRAGDEANPVLQAAGHLPVVGKRVRQVQGAVDLSKITKTIAEKLGKTDKGREAFEAGMAERAAQRAPVEAARAAAKTVTSGEKAAAAGTGKPLTSPKRIAEAEFKEKVAESRSGVPLDEMTPDLVRRQGVAMAEKRINAALAKGDMKTARATLEKINKEFGVKLNLADLAKKGKK